MADVEMELEEEESMHDEGEPFKGVENCWNHKVGDIKTCDHVSFGLKMTRRTRR